MFTASACRAARKERCGLSRPDAPIRAFCMAGVPLARRLPCPSALSRDLTDAMTQTVNSMSTKQSTSVRQPSVGMGLLLYLGYLAIFFSTWTIDGDDYQRIGESAGTTKLWHALPTLSGCAFLVVATSMPGWWRIALYERSKFGPLWAWILPVVTGGIIRGNSLGLQPGKLSAKLLLWSTLGAAGVGFGEEMITRGRMIVGLRSRFSEP
jgi:uncharacterized protein